MMIVNLVHTMFFTGVCCPHTKNHHVYMESRIAQWLERLTCDHSFTGGERVAWSNPPVFICVEKNLAKFVNPKYPSSDGYLVKSSRMCAYQAAEWLIQLDGLRCVKNTREVIVRRTETIDWCLTINPSFTCFPPIDITHWPTEDPNTCRLLKVFPQSQDFSQKWSCEVRDGISRYQSGSIRLETYTGT